MSMFIRDRHTRVMGVLNMTPDSFSDGGQFIEVDKATSRAWAIAREGAHILDVGAESSRPGAHPLSAIEERERLEPLLLALKAQKYPLPISLDTYKAETAAWALKEDLVQIINDIQGLRDPHMLGLVRESRVPVVVMHMFETPQTMQVSYSYDDVIEDLRSFFMERISKVQDVCEVLIDPGIGFGKSVQHNLRILRELNRFVDLGHPVLVGASRKRFIGEITQAEVMHRLPGSLTCAVFAAMRGAHYVRVHDVAETCAALRMLEALQYG